MDRVIEAHSSVPAAGAPAKPASPLNIAHVVDSMEMGGAEKLTATLCRLQRDRGHTLRLSIAYIRSA
jgi:hypothetical protein